MVCWIGAIGYSFRCIMYYLLFMHPVLMWTSTGTITGSRAGAIDATDELPRLAVIAGARALSGGAENDVSPAPSPLGPRILCGAPSLLLYLLEACTELRHAKPAEQQQQHDVPR